MELKYIAVDKLRPAPWSANVMTPDQLEKLRRSIQEFGELENLVVKPLPDGSYQVISGNQRLKLYEELGIESALCVIAEVSEAKAKLLSQILNRLRGEDDQGVKAKLVEEILAEVDIGELLGYLPDTAQEIDALLSMRHSTLEDAFEYWQKKVTLGLHAFQVVLGEEDYGIVNKAVAQATKVVKGDAKGASLRAKALAHICGVYLESAKTTK